MPGGRALSVAEEIVARQEELRAVWPGFWPIGQPFMLVDSQATVLYSPARSAPPAGFVPARGPRVAELAGMWLHAGVPPDLDIARGRNAHLEYDADGDVVTAVRVGDDVAEAIELLFHEQFHVFQRSHFRPTLPSAPVEGAPLDSVELARLDELERATLKRALAADPAHVGQVARDYVAIRIRRMSGQPDSVVQAEHGGERTEGSAQWVGMRMLTRVQGDDIGSFRGRLSELLNWRPAPASFDVVFDGLPIARRQRLYSTGAAILELLDRLGAPDWQTRLAMGEAPFDILVATISTSSRSRPRSRSARFGERNNNLPGEGGRERLAAAIARAAAS